MGGYNAPVWLGSIALACRTGDPDVPGSISAQCTAR